MRIKFIGYVYQLKCKVNNKVYVGITNNLAGRWNKHVYDAKHNSPCVIHRAMRKYGIKDFVIEVLEITFSKRELLRLEKRWIKKLGSHVAEGGYNQTFGGEAPMLGRKHTLESKKKISIALKGKVSPNKGRKASLKTKQKLSAIHSKSVVQIGLDGITVRIFKSITEASKVIGIAGSNISGVCNGKKKTAGGYHWKYNEDQ